MKSRIILVLLALALPTVVNALGLGTLELQSGLNQPFKARVKLLSATADELDSLKVMLADQEAFDRAGIQRNFLLSRLRFSVEESETGPDYIQIRSNESIREPFLNFLLEINWSRGRLFREYTALLDPPIYTAPATRKRQAIVHPEKPIVEIDSGDHELVYDLEYKSESSPVSQPISGADDERDPFEGFNRSVYGFNQAMDKALLNPVSKFYKAITPDFIENIISNFFSNLTEISIVANDIMQFKVKQAFLDSSRFIVNSTLGILGIFDVSSPMGLEKHEEDFGQTLGYWGFETGPYLMLPFLGPATVRDATGFIVDRTVLYPPFYLKDDGLRNGLVALNYVDVKSDLLSASKLISDAALDEYEFLKNAYLDRRASQVNDGLLPVSEEDFDF